MSPPRLPQCLLSRDHSQQPDRGSMAGLGAAPQLLLLQLLSLAQAQGVGRGKLGRQGLGVRQAGPVLAQTGRREGAGAAAASPGPCLGWRGPARWGSWEAGMWGPGEGGGFLLRPREEFLQAAAGERPWNLESEVNYLS